MWTNLFLDCWGKKANSPRSLSSSVCQCNIPMRVEDRLLRKWKTLWKLWKILDKKTNPWPIQPLSFWSFIQPRKSQANKISQKFQSLINNRLNPQTCWTILCCMSLFEGMLPFKRDSPLYQGSCFVRVVIVQVLTKASVHLWLWPQSPLKNKATSLTGSICRTNSFMVKHLSFTISTIQL